MPIITEVEEIAAVVIDDAKCIAEKGCTVCVDASTSARSTSSRSTRGARRRFMKYDECWYCMPCEPTARPGPSRSTSRYLLR